MNYSECIENARQRIGNYCKACPECNGRACRNQIPGPGAKGAGDTAIRNYDKWKEIRLNMDTIVSNRPVDTSISLFGKEFKYPFLQVLLVQLIFITVIHLMMLLTMIFLFLHVRMPGLQHLPVTVPIRV